MSDYLLIVWDFINWAKRNGIPMGPGRGSGAGSIVLYLIGVTDIEPLRFHLFFERFINPERISYPDIDVDICMDRRGDVIDYTLAEVWQRQCRADHHLRHDEGQNGDQRCGPGLERAPCQRSMRSPSSSRKISISPWKRRLKRIPTCGSCIETDEEAQRIIDIGQKLEGSIRNTGNPCRRHHHQRRSAHRTTFPSAPPKTLRCPSRNIR